MPAPYIIVLVPIPMQLLADEPGKIAGDGPYTWAPASHVGVLDGVPGTVPGHFSYLGSEPVGGRHLFLPFSSFIPPSLCLSNKYI